MATARSTEAEKKPEQLVELSKLIEGALARQGASARSIAERAGIGASHLSKFLKAQRTLKKAKLMVLADLLGIDREKILRLIGGSHSERPSLDLGRVTLLRTLEKFTLNVVATPRFYDGALLMWIFSNQPLTEVGIECQLRRAEWGNVPAELASYGYSVGLHSDTPQLFGLTRWSHLALYKAHAVIARNLEGSHGEETFAGLTEKARARGRRLRLITIDDSMVDLLGKVVDTRKNIDVQIIPNPDVALDSFRQGAGDLFLGGLPQRLALRSKEFREILTQGKDHPGFYSLNSLVCSDRMVLEKRALLHAIDALWYDTCRRLYAEPSFRARVFHEISDILDRHGVEKHNLRASDFEMLFAPGGQELEVFAQSPAQLMDEVMLLTGESTRPTHESVPH